MNEELDTCIEVRFVGDRGVSYRTIDKTLSAVAWTIERIEREELEAVLHHFSDLPSVARDAMRYRFEQVEQSRLVNIEKARTGSVVLTAAAAGLAYWVVDKTLGETLKEAWKGSEPDRELQAFLRQRVFRKRQRMTRYLQQQRFDMDSPVSTAALTQRDSSPVIAITVRESAVDAAVPKPSAVKREGRQGDA